jgi:hypothetical protein
MAVRIKLRRGTTAEWEANNPVLAKGELGLELATIVDSLTGAETKVWLMKVGDGITTWKDLAYVYGGVPKEAELDGGEL